MNYKKVLVAFIIQTTLAAGVVMAQTVVDFSAKHAASASRRLAASENTTLSDPMKNAATEKLIPVVITLDDANSISEIEALGIEPTAVEGNIVFARVDQAQFSELSNTKSVSRLSGQRRRHHLMFNGRIAGNVNDVHNGSEADRLPSITGKGVLVGIVDGGFDPNHITFRTADQSGLRVKQLSYYKSDDDGNLTGIDTYTPSQIPSFTTDDNSDYHATHVSNIAAGAYSGVTNGKSYQGVAPDADIFMGALYNYSDDEIIRACQDIRDMAAANGTPAVINMSLGVNVGPHDGTDAFSVALDNIAKTIPVFIAAGNEADLDIVINKTLTASDNTVRTSFTPNAALKAENKNYQVADQIQIWSDDSTPFDVNILIVNKTTGAVINSYPVTTSYKEITPSSTYYNTVYSFIECEKGLVSSNNRYCADIYMELLTKSSTWSTYPAIEVIGKAGQTIRVYNDGYYTDFSTKNFAGYDKATADGTINDMACGKNVIAVGAFNASVSGYPWTYFSSYGTLADGRKLPHFCAPGQNVVSAMSTPYYNANSYYESPVASFDVNGKTYYYGEMSGTSMATPFATGSAALLLQANPNLTPEQIRAILTRTAVAPATPDVKWGAGRINVFAAVKSAYETGGVIGVNADSEEVILFNRNGNSYEIYTPQDETPAVTVLDLAGRVVANVRGTGSTAVVDLSDLASGIYIINARGAGKSVSRKVTR